MAAGYTTKLHSKSTTEANKTCIKLIHNPISRGSGEVDNRGNSMAQGSSRKWTTMRWWWWRQGGLPRPGLVSRPPKSATIPSARQLLQQQKQQQRPGSKLITYQTTPADCNELETFDWLNSRLRLRLRLRHVAMKNRSTVYEWWMPIPVPGRQTLLWQHGSHSRWAISKCEFYAFYTRWARHSGIGSYKFIINLQALSGCANLTKLKSIIKLICVSSNRLKNDFRWSIKNIKFINPGNLYHQVNKLQLIVF